MKLLKRLIMIPSLLGLIACGSSEEEYREAVGNARGEKFRKAESFFENYILERPGFDSAWFYLGYCKQRNGDVRGAIKCYDQVTKLNPTFYEVYNMRGICKGMLGDTDGEMREYDKCIELAPDFHRPFYNRGNLKYDRGDLPGALNDYSKAIELLPDYSKARFNRGNVLDELKRYDEAIRDYYIAVKDSVIAGESFYQIGLDYLRTGDTIKACMVLDSALTRGFQKAGSELNLYCK